MPNEPYDFLDTYHPGHRNLSSNRGPVDQHQQQQQQQVYDDRDYDETSFDDGYIRNYPIDSDKIVSTRSDTRNIAPSIANSKQQQPTTRPSISGRSYDGFPSAMLYEENGRNHQMPRANRSNSGNQKSFITNNKSKKLLKKGTKNHIIRGPPNDHHHHHQHHHNHPSLGKKAQSASKNHHEKPSTTNKYCSFIKNRISKVKISLLESGLVSMKKFNKDVQTFLPKERMSLAEFEKHIKIMRKYEVIANSEYRYASKYETYACRHATKESNQIKNNYKKCIPYDYNRVVLKTLPNVPDSDYINASHIDSYLKPNAYIAAQGPNEFTIEDFWRMIWEQKTFVIVMLTKVFDFIRVMCNQYWPVELNKPEKYGQLEVTLLYEEPLADFVIRTIRLCRIPPVAVKKTDGILLKTIPVQIVTEDDEAEDDVESVGGGGGGGGGSDKASSSTSADNDDDDDDDDDDANGYDDADEDQSHHHHQRVSETAPPSDNLSYHTASNSASFPLFRQPKYMEMNNEKLSKTSKGKKKEDKRSNSHSNPNNKPSTTIVKIPEIVDPSEPLQRIHSAEILHNGDESQELSSNIDIIYQQSTMPTNPIITSSQYLTPNNLDGLNDNSDVSISQPSTPGIFLTPMTPFTGSPSTPGTPESPLSGSLSLGKVSIDRTSATRKPVKKKKRERKRNLRPIRTQFQAPDEAALNDDDDVEYYHENDEGFSKQNQRQQQQVLLDGSQTAGVSSHNTNERIIYQFHYHSWASHTCPSIDSLLHFRRRVRICMEEMSKSGKTGPTVVHCNDGCGRTGTYLCIDTNLELGEEDGVYDVFNYTMKMRQSRKCLIDNIKQYKFVYDTIEEAMLCGKTWFPVSELSQRLKHKSQRNPLTQKNEYQREYEKITSRMTNKFSIGDCAGGHRVDNREKNRDVSTVPPDNFRPYLTSFQSNDNTDYINAVFVDGYTRSKEYIVTEWPTQKTISDFWSLIYDHDCNSVILLANPIDSSTYPQFLLGEKERQRKFGPVFTADKIQSNEYQNIKSWIYTINKKIMALSEVMAGMKPEPKTTQIFQITCWPQGHRVPTSTNTLVELMNMVERWRQRTTYGPVCVVSLDGKSRAGVYCAANVAIEQVVQHGEVDVFQAVKTVRRHRPQLIENMTEYKYCYDLILHYVLHYLNQNNTT